MKFPSKISVGNGYLPGNTTSYNKRPELGSSPSLGTPGLKEAGPQFRDKQGPDKHRTWASCCLLVSLPIFLPLGSSPRPCKSDCLCLFPCKINKPASQAVSPPRGRRIETGQSYIEINNISRLVIYPEPTWRKERTHSQSLSSDCTHAPCMVCPQNAHPAAHSWRSRCYLSAL